MRWYFGVSVVNLLLSIQNQKSNETKTVEKACYSPEPTGMSEFSFSFK